MQKKVLLIIFLFYGLLSKAQECPRISNPANGSVQVPVDAIITWPAVDGIFGYLISLGTTPGGTDILNRRSAGQTNSFTPEVGLPDDTLIYVTIEMFLPNQQLLICPSESFRTVDVTDPPPCTLLNNPVNLENNVSINETLNWNYAPTATGYRITIGTSSGGTEIVDDLDVGNVLSYDPTVEIPLNQQIFVQITPYNENGSIVPCTEESFTTGIPTVDCLFYYDSTTGATIKLQPEIDFPDQIGICENNVSIIQSKDKARGFRWFRINADDSETLISETDEVSLTEIGSYRYEAYNTVIQFGATIECASVKEFTVVSSEAATIIAIHLNRESSGLNITVQTSGTGDYEFSLDAINGPYQDSNVFSGVPIGEHTVYVNDKNGCGTVERIIDQSLSKDDFPRFFTPNGDLINDFWQFIVPTETGEINIESIWVFDRYGSLLTQIDPRGQGWNGDFNGKPLPASDYWFKAITFNKQVIRGHFALKR